MAIVINGQTGIDAGHLPISNAGNTEIEGTLTGANVTVASITANSVITQGQNVSPFSGFKNYIINGNFDVWQYGTSQTSSGYGSDDRWSNANVGSSKTHSLQLCSDTERELFNANYFSRTVVNSVAGANNFCIKNQSIENVTKLAGKTVTLSFWAKADSAKNIAIEFGQNFGTGGSPSSALNGAVTQLIALTTTWQKFTRTITIPSIAGKTLGTDGAHTTLTFLCFWFDAGSSFNARSASLGQQSGTFDIAQVQLEEGSVATPFENRPYGLELSLCQRYYEVISAIYKLSTVYGAETTGAYAVERHVTVPFAVTKRVPYGGYISNTTFTSTTGVGVNGGNRDGISFVTTAGSNPIITYTVYDIKINAEV